MHVEPAHGRRILERSECQPRPGRLGSPVHEHERAARGAKVDVCARRECCPGAARELRDGERPCARREAQRSGAVTAGVAVANPGIERQR